MSTVKGILKGLRYISQIFEKEEEEEEEIQIGNPTDVKHVAHIGNEGPSNSKPSWMKEASSEANSNGNSGNKSSSKEVQSSSDSSGKPEKKKQTKRHAAKTYIGSIGSTGRDPPSGAKPRRNKNSSTDSQSSYGMDSPSRDPNTPKKSSRPKKSKAGTSKSKAQDQDGVDDNFSSSPGPGYEKDSGKISQRSAS
ncbi:CRIB domain-containing protein [Heracleum sosnowskyi]|uniref:CRIB domain-containing protein n=1 Tax=Heracleum sosnowskyi TaxID=360622 RepID=A0AAD8J2E6_9APIA|nr:CRIB domain-containing protein [Heracleum sosnowskyi]